ncbi:MAG: M28 family peptidase [Holophaga sp.]|nr:M28 family peptidase [Holophaga sp.]
MRFLACLGVALCMVAPVAAQDRPPVSLMDLAGRVEPSRLSRTVDRLASFGTRHTLSDPVSERRGIGAARRWLTGELQALPQIPGSRLVIFEDSFSAGPGPLLPKATTLTNLGVMLPGTDLARTREALVVAAHYDSRTYDVLDGSGDAPGAVDNASGVAAVMELATVLAAERPAISIYFVATAGGAQGSLGSARLAARLKAEGTDVVGMLAVDCVGNVLGSDGGKNGGAMRLFSDGVPVRETDGEKRVRELLGTENDGVGRELARYLKRCGERFVENFDCAVMLRRDRLGRSGEQSAFTREGFPGVRVSEFTDPFDRLGQDARPGAVHRYSDTPTFFDPGYCARITRVLVTGLRQLACAPAGPQNVGLSGGGTSDAKLWWTLPQDPRIVSVVIYRRRADGVQWQQTHVIPKAESIVLPGVGTDNDVFAVATMDAQGNESLPVIPRSIEFN